LLLLCGLLRRRLLVPRLLSLRLSLRQWLLPLLRLALLLLLLLPLLLTLRRLLCGPLHFVEEVFPHRYAGPSPCEHRCRYGTEAGRLHHLAHGGSPWCGQVLTLQP
jgi:hypothetical protein